MYKYMIAFVLISAVAISGAFAGEATVKVNVETANTEISSPVPTDFNFETPKVNMRNGETQFRVQVPEDGNLTVVLYDRLGREMRELHDGEIKAGSYTFMFRDYRIPLDYHYMRAEYKSTIADGSTKAELR